MLLCYLLLKKFRTKVKTFVSLLKEEGVSEGPFSITVALPVRADDALFLELAPLLRAK